MDLSVNAIALTIQIFASSRFFRHFGLGWALALAPLILGTGLLALWIVPILAVVVATQVLQRAGNYAIMRPAREILFVSVSAEEKYKAKNVIDTVVYRGGDLVSAWIYAGLQAAGFAASGIAFSALAVTGVCTWLSFRLSRRHESLSLLQTS
jgi:AAA family ATP:ADP antiporter